MCLTGVLLAAAQSDKKMWKGLPAILRQGFSLHGDSRNGVPELVLYGTEQWGLHTSEHTILICRTALPQPPVQIGAAADIAIVDADADGELLEYVGSTGLPAITCGLSSRETMSLSSYNEHHAVLAIQRALPCFDGSLLEPQEIPLHLHRCSDRFLLMAASAVYLLNGRREQLKQAVFGVKATNNYHS